MDWLYWEIEDKWTGYIGTGDKLTSYTERD